MDAAEDTHSTASSTTVAKEDAPTDPAETNPIEGSSTDSVDSSGNQKEEGDALEEGEILVRGFQLFVVTNVDIQALGLGTASFHSEKTVDRREDTGRPLIFSFSPIRK